MGQTDEAIWEGDLLGREEEAELLIAYIESLSGQPQFQDEKRAFTIAVDAGYGEGKTWFLKRLARQLAINHPVAFVDAWQDDLADEPLTALVATMKSALAKHFPKQANLKSKFDVVIEKSGSIAKIAGKGLLKRAAGLLITNEAVALSETVLSEATEAVQAAIQDGLKDGSQALVDDTAAVMERTSPANLMKDRIADFEAGQKAIADLKVSLEDVVASMDGNQVHPPIVIVIDELDRCRPTYAVKLLEEIKHLFDVPGLVFIFGMHRGQLAHSVKSAYGADFDGHAYLGRFIHRHYRLAQPTLVSFVRHHLEKLGAYAEKLWFPTLSTNSHPTTSEKIAFYLKRYGLSARDVISVFETLRTSCALTKKIELFMPLLLPMILAKIKGASRGSIGSYDNADAQLTFRLMFAETEAAEDVDWWNLATRSHPLMLLPELERRQRLRIELGNHTLHLFEAFCSDASNSRVPIASPARYSDLIEAVGRFGGTSSDSSIKL